MTITHGTLDASLPGVLRINASEHGLTSMPVVEVEGCTPVEGRTPAAAAGAEVPLRGYKVTHEGRSPLPGVMLSSRFSTGARSRSSAESNHLNSRISGTTVFNISELIGSVMMLTWMLIVECTNIGVANALHLMGRFVCVF